jgi:hypothetical protein
MKSIDFRRFFWLTTFFFLSFFLSSLKVTNEPAFLYRGMAQPSEQAASSQ